MDYIFRWMDLKFGEHAGDADGTVPDGADETRDDAGLKEAEIAAAAGLKAMAASAGGPPGSPWKKSTTSSEQQADSPPCPECGSVTVRNGACYKCHNCGATTGCS